MTTAGRSLRDRVDQLDAKTAVLAVVLGIVPAWYVSWLLADFSLRGVGFALGWIAASWVLVDRTWPRDVGIAWLRLLAGLVLLTPIFLELPFILNAGRFGIGTVADFVLTESNLITVVVFAILAAVPAGIARWLAHSDIGTGP